jgi:NADPH:quinone reductase-like Zn-dependent oxidoreductase
MAEYAKADVDQVVLKPGNISAAEAATVPLSALTAWQALFVHGDLQKGQRLLITGAAGGTGVFAIQFANQVGAHVIATGSSARSRELSEKFGVDEFIDYKSTNLQAAAHDVDLVLDCVGGPVIEQCFKVVKKGGKVVSINTWDAKEKGAVEGVDAKFFIVNMDTQQLKTVNKMIEEEKVQTVVDRTFPLSEAPAAFEHCSQGHVHGKVVLTVP